MNWGFQNKTLLTDSPDGWHCHLREWLEFHDHLGNRWRTKTETDGGSTPWLLWWLVPPFGSRDWFSFILHDGAYRDALEKYDWQQCQWKKITLDERRSNDLLYSALTSQGYGSFKKLCVYLALEWFGWRAFSEDRKKLCPK